MSWAKLDDAILDNPKIVAAGPLCFALYVAGITWSCRNLTDGFIPADKVPVLLNWHGFVRSSRELRLWFGDESPENTLHASITDTRNGELGADKRDIAAVLCTALAQRLVTEALWGVVPRGYLIHDFLVYNRSKEHVLKERQAAKERKQGKGSRKVRTKFARTSQEFGRSSAPPVPVPVPSTEEADPPSRERKALSLSPPPVSAPPKKATQWPTDFDLTLARADVARQLGIDAAGEWNKFRDHALKDGITHKNWDAAWRYWCRRAPDFQGRRIMA